MQAVILAGGAGTRLRPLTLNTPKPMIEVNDKPFLVYIIDILKKYGVTDVVLCVGYLADKFKGFFEDGKKLGVKIRYSVEKEFLGTAGAVKLASHMLRNEFFVINGDTYLPFDCIDVYDVFKRSGKKGIIVLYDNNANIAEPNIAIDKNMLVVSYFKSEALKKGDVIVKNNKQKDHDCRYLDAGVQIFKKNVFDSLPADKFLSIEFDVYPKLIGQRQLAAYVTDKRYYDLGTHARLAEIRKVLK